MKIASVAFLLLMLNLTGASQSANNQRRMSPEFIGAAQKLVLLIRDRKPVDLDVDAKEAALKSTTARMDAATKTHQEEEAQNQVILFLLNTEKNNISRRRMAAGAPEFALIDKAETDCAAAMNRMLGTGVFSELPVCWDVAIDVSHAKMQ